MDTREVDAETDYKVMCIVENYMGSVKSNWLSFWLHQFCYGVSVCMDPGNHYRSPFGCGFHSPLSEAITSTIPQTHAVGEFYQLSLDLCWSDVFLLFYYPVKLYYMCCHYWLGTSECHSSLDYWSNNHYICIYVIHENDHCMCVISIELLLMSIMQNKKTITFVSIYHPSNEVNMEVLNLVNVLNIKCSHDPHGYDKELSDVYIYVCCHFFWMPVIIKRKILPIK